MTALYLPPCRCPEPEEGDPSTHLPGCPRYDSAHDPPALADEPARSYWRASDKPPIPACECGAPIHPGETHTEALIGDTAACSPGCTCPGYCGTDGEPAHDGLCALAEPPKPIRSGLVFLPSANEHDPFPVF